MLKSLVAVPAVLLVASLATGQSRPPTKPKDAFTNPPRGSAAAGGATEGWVKQLKDRDAKNRVQACETLGGMGEAAADAAGPLCDATLDASPKVATAAVHAIEKVRPDLYKPLTALVLDASHDNRLRGTKELGLMGEKALPAINVLLTNLRKELTRGPAAEGQLSAMQTELFNAVRQIKPDDTNTIKMYKAIGAGTNRHVVARGEALTFLHDWAGEDALRRQDILPLVRAGLTDNYLQIQCIRHLGEYGTLAKSCVPQLKQLKLSSNAAVREAATASLDKIENQ